MSFISNILGLKTVNEELKQSGVAESGKGIVAPTSKFNFNKSSKGENQKDDAPQNFDLQKKYYNAYNNFPLVTAIIDSHADTAVVDFHWEGPKEKELTKKNSDYNLHTFFHKLAKELPKHGNAWVETPMKAGKIEEFKFLDPRTMWTVRKATGEVTAECQVINNKVLVWGSVDKNSDPMKGNFGEAKKVGDLNDIIHFRYNVQNSEKYGSSLIHPMLSILDTKQQMESDMKYIVKRYVAPIIDITVGSDTHPATQTGIDDIKDKLIDLHADSEFIHDHNTVSKVLEFKNAALSRDLFDQVDTQIIVAGKAPRDVINYPAGSGKGNEVSLRQWNRAIKSLQRDIKTQFEDEVLIKRKWGNEKDKLVWDEVEERERETGFEIIRGLVKDGILTPQKANDLLPPVYREKLPEMVAVPLPGQEKDPGDKVKSNPNNPQMSTREKEGERVKKSEVKSPLDNKSTEKGRDRGGDKK